MKGILVTILRAADGSDCTNGGISSRFTKAIVIGPGIPEHHAPDADTPGFKLVRNHCNTAKLVPLEQPDGKASPMFGGNFAHTSDRHWNEALFDITGHRYYGAVPIHDRFEG